MEQTRWLRGCNRLFVTVCWLSYPCMKGKRRRPVKCRVRLVFLVVTYKKLYGSISICRRTPDGMLAAVIHPFITACISMFFSLWIKARAR